MTFDLSTRNAHLHDQQVQDDKQIDYLCQKWGHFLYVDRIYIYIKKKIVPVLSILKYQYTVIYHKVVK